MAKLEAESAQREAQLDKELQSEIERASGDVRDLIESIEETAREARETAREAEETAQEAQLHTAELKAQQKYDFWRATEDEAERLESEGRAREAKQVRERGISTLQSLEESEGEHFIDIHGNPALPRSECRPCPRPGTRKNTKFKLLGKKISNMMCCTGGKKTIKKNRRHKTRRHKTRRHKTRRHKTKIDKRKMHKTKRDKRKMHKIKTHKKYKR